jgi:hypothetical protein
MRKRKNAELRKPEILEHFYQVIIQELEIFLRESII